MKKYYWLVPLFAGIGFIVSAVDIYISLSIFFFLPIGSMWWLHRDDADLFLHESDVNTRICFLALSNNSLVAFLAERLSEDWLKIENYLVESSEDDVYIYKGKIVSFALQSEDIEVDDILELKDSVDPGVFSRRALLSNESLKSFAFPAVGTFLLFTGLLPSFFSWIILLAGPHYLLYKVWDSGALDFIYSQAGDEITIFYIRGSRKLNPTKAESIGEDWWNYTDGLGKVKTVDNTDYYFNGTRVYFSGAGVPTTFSLEFADKAHWFREIGLRSWEELDTAMSMVDNSDYDSFEDAYREKGEDLIKAVRTGDEQVFIEKEVK